MKPLNGLGNLGIITRPDLNNFLVNHSKNTKKNSRFEEKDLTSIPAVATNRFDVKIQALVTFNAPLSSD
jgi:hypothetical protein